MNEGYVYVATRMLTLNGRDYGPGDAVDLTGVSHRRVFQLYEMRKIAPVAPIGKATRVAAARTRTAPLVEAPPEPVAGPEGDETGADEVREGEGAPEAVAGPESAPEAAPEPPVAEAAPARAKAAGKKAGRHAVHKGFGRYDVFDGEARVAQGVPRSDLPSLGVNIEG